MAITMGTKKVPLLLIILALLVGLGFWFLGRYIPLERLHPSQTPPDNLQGIGKIKTASTEPVASATPTLLTMPWAKIIKRPEFLKTYRLKRRLELLGFQFTHLEHRKIPQQVIIAEHVPPDSSALLFSKKVNIDLVTLVSNQLMALRKQKKGDPTQEHLRVEKLETVSTEPLLLSVDESAKQKKRHRLQHRQVAVTIRLMSEEKPRQYLASIVRYPASLEMISGPSEQVSSSRLDTVVVTFARPKDFNPKLLGELLVFKP
ncbi:MAG: hypothetical protein VKJ04_11290 [Vampirovibrionales bacterium]|nr:hypothetical protein [Vampirovibrionales bacterium]